MTREEYQRVCDQLARDANAYAARMAEAEDPSNVTDEREHWIDVFLDEHVPFDVAEADADELLALTSHADAFEKSSGGRPASSRKIAALHAFQADVWDAINRTETT